MKTTKETMLTAYGDLIIKIAEAININIAISELAIELNDSEVLEMQSEICNLQNSFGQISKIIIKKVTGKLEEINQPII